MSDLFGSLMGRAKETLDKAKSAAADLRDSAASGELAQKAGDALQGAKEKAGELFEGAKGAVSDLRERAASGDLAQKAGGAFDRAKDAASDALERVKGGVGSFVNGREAPTSVKNEFFDGLDEEVAQQREAARAQAEEMQRRIDEILGKRDGE